MATSLPTSMLAASARRSADGSLGESAYRQIKELIVSLELPPASLIDERALAARLGVGLTPVRQALRRLAWESLVVILPRRGTLVADLNAADLQKIYELRHELEGLAARLAAERASDAQLVQLDDIVERTKTALAASPPDHHDLIGLDRELHRWLAAAAHNELLEGQLDWLYSHVMRLWNVAIDRVGSLPGAIEEHIAIAQAVRVGDGELAARRMRAHVTSFQEAFRKA